MKKKKANREEKPADVFLTDFCSHNIESRRVIVSSSERWKNIIIPILKDASDPAGLGLLGWFIPMDLLLPSWHPLRSPISLAATSHPSNTRPLKFQIRRLTGLSTRLVALSLSVTFLPLKAMHFRRKQKKIIFWATLNRLWSNRFAVEYFEKSSDEIEMFRDVCRSNSIK